MCLSLTDARRPTLPARLDSSSPPMTLTLFVDLSFWQDTKKRQHWNQHKSTWHFQNGCTQNLPAVCTAVAHFWFNEIIPISVCHPLQYIKCPASAQVVPGNETRKGAYTVALHPNEIHCQWDWFIAVLVQRFNVVQEVSEELVAPFQHTQSHDVVSPHVPDYVAGQALRPASDGEKRIINHSAGRFLKVEGGDPWHDIALKCNCLACIFTALHPSLSKFIFKYTSECGQCFE